MIPGRVHFADARVAYVRDVQVTCTIHYNVAGVRQLGVQGRSAVRPARNRFILTVNTPEGRGYSGMKR